MSDLIERLRRLYVQNGTNYVQEAADEIERLTAAAQHEADCVEAYRAQVEMVIRERDELRKQIDECSQMLARQARTIRELTRPAEES